MKPHQYRGQHLVVIIACSAILHSPAYSSELPSEAELKALLEQEDLFLNEIVVTATKRSSNLQDVPISVSAISGDRLRDEAAADIRDVQRIDPHITFFTAQSTINTTALSIRGISSSGNNLGFESTVGVFVDGFYQSRPGIALGELVDIEQVELLRGPQGTLFGRNTAGGALNVKTRTAKIGEQTGFASVTLGNYELVNLKAGLNISLNDASALRLAGSTRKRDGTLEAEIDSERDHNDQDRYLLRGSYVWEPNLDSRFELRIDHSESEERCCSAVLATQYQPDPALAALPLEMFHGANEINPEKRLAPGNNAFESSSQTGVSSTYRYSFNDWNINLLSSYRDVNSDNWGDSDLTGSDLLFIEEDNPNSINLYTQSQELRFNGKTFNDKLDWLFGIYYLKESISEQVNRIAGSDIDNILATLSFAQPVPTATTVSGSTASNRFAQKTESHALYLHNIYDINESLSWTLGLRYADERKSGGLENSSGSNDACAAAITGLSATPGPLNELYAALYCTPVYSPAAETPLISLYDTGFTDYSFTYNSNLNLQLTEDISTYASYSTGFKSGGINLDVSGGGAINPTFKSERIRSSEIGFKSQLLDNRLTLNTSIYHMIMKNLQTLEFVGSAFVVFSVPEVRSQGLELDLDFLVTDFLRLQLGYAFTDTKVDLQIDPDRGTCTTIKTDSSNATCGTSNLPSAPEHTIVLGSDIKISLDGDLAVSLHPLIRYESSSRPEGDQIDYKTDANTIIDLRLRISHKDSSTRLDIWGKNLTDEVVETSSFSTISASLTGGSSLSSFINEPRTFGATLTHEF